MSDKQSFSDINYANYAKNGYSDTIFALSSGRDLPTGVAIVRVSGKNLSALHCFLPNNFISRKAYLRQIFHPKTKAIIDHAVIIHFASGESFTGEEVMEFHLHGSKAVINGFAEMLVEEFSYRQAMAGEFIYRRFLSGKSDLTEVEGLDALLNSETQAQLNQAWQGYDGKFKAMVEAWKQQSMQNLVPLEAEIDFADEDDVDADPALITKIKDTHTKILNEVDKLRAGAKSAERVKNGFKILIIGAVNSGKSTLINALIDRQIAIVSDIPGTTRDVIEGQIRIGDYPAIIMDTAGLRETADIVEQMGIKRVYELINAADLILFLESAEDLLGNDSNISNANHQETAPEITAKIYQKVDQKTLNNYADIIQNNAEKCIFIHSKLDKIDEKGVVNGCSSAILSAQELSSPLLELLKSRNKNIKQNEAYQNHDAQHDITENIQAHQKAAKASSDNLSHKSLETLAISAKTGAGMPELINKIAEKLDSLTMPLESRLVQNERQLRCLNDLHAQISRLIMLVTSENLHYDQVILAEEIRQIMHIYGKIVGEYDVEDMLDNLFRGFCIGK